jgi:hypothetical protein
MKTNERPPRWAIADGYEWSAEAQQILPARMARSLRSKAHAQIRRLRKLAEITDANDSQRA